jgi:hypothetical protein
MKVPIGIEKSTFTEEWNICSEEAAFEEFDEA